MRRRREPARTWRRRLARILPAAAVLALGAGGLAWRISRGEAPEIPTAEVARGWEIPQPDTGLFSPLVAGAMGEARARVMAEPDSPEAWGGYGEVLDAHDFLDDASIAYRHAIQLAPREPRWHYLLAHALMQSGAPFPEQRASFEAALELAPEETAVRVRYAQALMVAGLPDEATVVLGPALAARPDLGAVHEAHGKALLAAGRPTEAEAALRRALATAPDSARALSTLSRALHEQGRTTEAEDAAQQAKAATGKAPMPDRWRRSVTDRTLTPSALAKRAEAALEAGRPAEAIPLWRLLLETGGVVPDERATAHAKLGTAYLATGALDDAEREFRKALEMQEDLFRAHAGMAGVHGRRGDLASAMPHLRRAVELQPENENARLQLALGLSASGDHAGALEQLERAAGADGRLGQSGEVQWGEALLRAGQPQEAIAHFQRALQAWPADVGALRGLSAAWRGLGNVEKAALFEGRARDAERDGASSRQLARGDRRGAP